MRFVDSVGVALRSIYLHIVQPAGTVCSILQPCFGTQTQFKTRIVSDHPADWQPFSLLFVCVPLSLIICLLRPFMLFGLRGKSTTTVTGFCCCLGTEASTGDAASQPARALAEKKNDHRVTAFRPREILYRDGRVGLLSTSRRFRFFQEFFDKYQRHPATS